MPNKLDEIIRVIGHIEAEVRGLSASVAEVRHSTAEHHRDSRERLETITKTLATMVPIVAGYIVTRWRIAGAFALGITVITMLGWVVSLFAGKIIAWLVSLFIAR